MPEPVVTTAAPASVLHHAGTVIDPVVVAAPCVDIRRTEIVVL